MLGVGAGLLVEIAVRLHAGQLDHPAQLDLAPAAAHIRSAQGVAEGAGFLLQGMLAVEQLPHLFAQLGVGHGPGLLQADRLAF